MNGLTSRMSRLAPRMGRLAPIAVLAMLLAGCDGGQTDLQAWMEETRRTTPRVSETVSEPKSFQPFRYSAPREADPFDPVKLRVDVIASSTRSGTFQPDLNRQREPLESFPLDAMQMVGHLRQGASSVALVQVEARVHSVKVGHHLGQNFGQVIRVSENEIVLRERVQDAAGEWVIRETTLSLQEGKR